MVAMIHYEPGDLLLITKTPVTLDGSIWDSEIRAEDEIILHVSSAVKVKYAGKVITGVTLVWPKTKRIIRIDQDELFKCSDPITL